MPPIKVRGKKRRKIPHESPSWLRPSNHLRPCDPFSGSRAATGGPPRKKSRTHPSRVLASLERLPTELLEEVFFWCLNINLPKASPVLSSALSSFHVKSQLFFKAFSSDHGDGLQHSEELIDILYSKQDVANLQSSILRLRWMTTEFLRLCRPIFFERTLWRLSKSFRWQWIDGTPAAKLTHAQVERFVQEAYRYIREREEAGKENLGHLGWSYIVSDEQTIDIQFHVLNGIVSLGDTRSWPPARRWKMINCLDECRIPEKLLHGPWTDEKCEFLTVLLRGGATVDWINSTSGEVAEWGLYDAFKEHNERAVRLIIPNRFRQSFPHDVFVSELHFYTSAIACRDNIKHEKEIFGVGVTPSMEHLRIAAIDCDCPLEILAVILKGENFPLERKDPALTSWALQKKVEGDKRGEWLLNVLDWMSIYWEMDDPDAGEFQRSS